MSVRAPLPSAAGRRARHVPETSTRNASQRPSTKLGSQGLEGLGEFRYRPRPGATSLGRWVRILVGLAVAQAVTGVFIWLRPLSYGMSSFALAPHVGVSNLSVFADPDAKIENLQTKPDDIAVLVLSTGQNVAPLRECLKSLRRVDGFNLRNVLVAQDMMGEASQRVVENEFGIAWIGPIAQSGASSLSAAKSRSAESVRAFSHRAPNWQSHYRRSLGHASWQHFSSQRYRSIFVAEEEMIFSPDLLWYLSQLEPLLASDHSLWCVSAWHDNGVSPYIADLTAVMRTDWFSGIGWLARLDELRAEILPKWPEELGWRGWLHHLQADKYRQCLFPEIPRVAFSTTSCKAAGQCGTDEAMDRQISMRTIISNSMMANLGDVSRLEASKYKELFWSSWPYGQGMAFAKEVGSTAELEASLEHLSIEARRREFTMVDVPRHPLLLTVAHIQESNAKDGPLVWHDVARYFGLPSGVPRCAYDGVIRLWWRDFTLYLVADTSPLLSGHAGMGGSHGKIRAGDLFMRSVEVAREQPVPVPPHSIVDKAPTGLSCSRFCESMKHVCIEADLVAADKCAMPLKSVFNCRHCVQKGHGPAFPGWYKNSNECIVGAVSGDGEPNSPDCSTSTFEVDRLCVCRRARIAPVKVQSPLKMALSPRDIVVGASPARLRAFQAAVRHDATQVTYSVVNRFAPSASSPPATEIPVSALAILVVAVVASRQSVNDLLALRTTLATLSAADGFDRDRVLVVCDDSQLATSQLVEEFHLTKIEVRGLQILQASQRASYIYRAAIDYAVTSHFGRSRSIILLEEGVHVAPDLLWYFAQLEPVLHLDKSLLCASAWNDNGIAPYVADSSVIMRTDFFSGVAWMARAELLKEELLPRWPEAEWEQFIRKPNVRHRRQCLFPELSRAKPSFGAVLNEFEKGTNRHSQLYDTHGQNMPLSTHKWAHLGDVRRLLDARYRDLFTRSWPEEGLANAQDLRSIRPITDGRANSGGLYRLVFRNSDHDHDPSWGAMAAFFGLWPEVPIRGAYLGVTRLRWRNSVLFLVPASSPLAREPSDAIMPIGHHDAGQVGNMPLPIFNFGSLHIVDPTIFLAASRPVLLPANGELVGSMHSGTSCVDICQGRGLHCAVEDLYYINNCAALAGVFSCQGCEPSEGREQPAQVSKPMTSQHGKCLYNTNIQKFPPSCRAAHPDTFRLCVCRSDGQAGSKAEDMPGLKFGTIAEGATTVAPTTEATTSTTSPTRQGTLPPPLFASKLLTKPQDIKILVIATGRRETLLRQCLQSLANLPGFDRRHVLVSQDGIGDETRRVAEMDFRTGFVRNPGEGLQNFRPFGVRVSTHYKFSIEYALSTHFPKAEALVVIEEDVIVAPDFLWYFAQLEPMLQEDRSLWCISAWNEIAISPYVADPAALLRTDVFSGVAWMLQSSLWRREMLPQWPQNNWVHFLRNKIVRHGRQCIIPEMPRVRHIGKLSEDLGANPAESYMRDISLFWFPSETLHAVDLGDVSRLANEIYRVSFLAEMRGAKLITNLMGMPEPSAGGFSEGTGGDKGKDDHGAQRHSDRNVLPSWRIHLECKSLENGDSWRAIAAYFRLPDSSGPRATYYDVLRLRWGAGVLFLIASGSPLIFEARLHHMPDYPFVPRYFAEAKSQILLPSDSKVVPAQQLGMSCTAVCSYLQRDCIPADLKFINNCETMRRFHFCNKCEGNTGPDQPAIVSRIGNEFFGRCLFNEDLYEYPPSCEASHADTRRICVCRAPIHLAKPTVLSMPSLGEYDIDINLGDDETPTVEASSSTPFPSQNRTSTREAKLRAADPSVIATKGTDAILKLKELSSTAISSDKLKELTGAPEMLSSTSSQAAISSTSTSSTTTPFLYLTPLRSVGWEVGSKAKPWRPQGINGFADPYAPISFQVHPSELSVLVIATGQHPEMLRRCLTSLHKVTGFRAGSVLVIQQGGNRNESRKVSETVFHFGAKVFIASPDAGTSSRHYHDALKEAITTYFRGAVTLLVLEENQIFSPDLLVYFAQIQPMLVKEKTLWCVSAWNDNGLAPYAVDHTALLRTDWFSGIAWMMRVDTLLADLLPKWPAHNWKEFARKDDIRKERQCVIPEVSRVKLFVAPEAPRKERNDFDEHVLPMFWNEWHPSVNLGDVKRMVSSSYDRLLFTGWPGAEGLTVSTEILLVTQLQDINYGTLRMVVSEDEGTWRAVAGYFGLMPSEKPMASNQDVIRLRWRGAVLYIALRTSVMLARAAVSVSVIFSMREFPTRSPMLVAPDVIVVIGSVGESCDAACAEAGREAPGLYCHPSDLLFLNACSVMRKHGGAGSCKQCVASSGQDQPSVSLAIGPPDMPSAGSCLWNANLAEPPLCEASHPWTARICACRPGRPHATWERAAVHGENKVSQMVLPPVPPRAFSPRNAIDFSLDSHRCGALFGNRLSADCMDQGLWCCSAGMWCGTTLQHCGNTGQCSEGASPNFFCGNGWSVRLPSLGLSPPAER